MTHSPPAPGLLFTIFWRTISNLNQINYERAQISVWKIHIDLFHSCNSWTYLWLTEFYSFFFFYQGEMMKMSRLNLPKRMCWSHLAIFALTIIVILETSSSTSSLSKKNITIVVSLIGVLLGYIVDMLCLFFRKWRWNRHRPLTRQKVYYT